MTGKSVSRWQEGRGRNADPSHPGSMAGRFAARLEQIRAMVHQGLDRIEVLLRERMSESSGREGAYDQRLHELEMARARHQVEVERWQQTRQAQIDELEHDRNLLAEAWERLEQERILAANRSRAVSEAAPDTSATSPSIRQPPKTIESDLDSPVSQTILRQFEALRHDVRRSAEERRSV